MYDEFSSTSIDSMFSTGEFFWRSESIFGWFETIVFSWFCDAESFVSFNDVANVKVVAADVSDKVADSWAWGGIRVD